MKKLFPNCFLLGCLALPFEICHCKDVDREVVLPKLGEALTLTPAEIEELSNPALQRREARDETASGFSIDRNSRSSVVAAFHQYYQTSEDYESNHGWNGNVKFCDPGSVSQSFQNDTLRRVNWFRAQAGLPADIYFDTNKSSKCQQAALMMSRNNALSHEPPASWSCYSAAGADGAANGNLSIGNFGPGAVNSQMFDDGSNNAAVGHRRWLLYSRAQVMGSGSIPTNNQGFSPAACIWVADDFKAPVAARVVAWPNEGFVPVGVVPNDSQSFPRWSFSYPGADFSSARVTMNRGSTSVPVTLETLVANRGDNTLVWRPQGIPAGNLGQDMTYTVVVSGITGAPQSTYRYDVTLVDPFELADEPVIVGPTNPFVGVSSSYDFSTTEGAAAYQVSVASAISGTWLEGAESLGSVADNTSSSYALQSSALAASGRYAFHLTFPQIKEIEQNFVIDREMVPSAGSVLRFKNRFRFVTEETELIAEISQNGGGSWQSIWSRKGDAASGGNSANWESVWRWENVPIPGRYHGRSVSIRFRLARLKVTSRVAIGTSDRVGAFIDDIELTRSTELVGSGLTDLSGAASGFRFTPSEERAYVFRVRAQLGTHWFGFGPVFTVTPTSAAPSPVVRSVSPRSAKPGSLVTLVGDYFSPVPSQNLVKFGETQAVVTAAATTMVTARIPNGIIGNVNITLSVGGRASGAIPFEILGAPSIAVTPSGLNFGEIRLGQSRQLIVQVRNEGTAALSVSQVSSTNSAFSVNPSGAFSVPPNALRDVVVTFAPQSVGTQRATLSMVSDDASSPRTTVSLLGTGVSKLIVYQTDFAQFDKGLNTIVGVDGWDVIHPGSGVTGTVDTTAGPDLGRSAFVGFNVPTDDVNGIFRVIDRDPLAEGSPIVEFSVDLAVLDSSNFLYDIFSFRLYNAQNNLLATVTLDNRNLDIYTWDGVDFSDTGKRFENDVLFTLSGRINLEANTWTAEMRSGSPGSNHFPLFENIPFHTGGNPLDLGTVFFAWQLDDSNAPGDNWMLIDNLSLALVGTGSAPSSAIAITRAWRDRNGAFRMNWPARPSQSYEVHYSHDLINWSTGLPGSTFTTSGEQEHTFVDTSKATDRFYRVIALP